MFGKKESIFDKDQNTQLQQLMKNQAILIKNNSYFIAQIKELTESNEKLWKWINNLDPRAKNLEARMTANEQKDAERAKAYASLAQVSQTEVETEGEK